MRKLNSSNKAQPIIPCSGPKRNVNVKDTALQPVLNTEVVGKTLKMI